MWREFILLNLYGHQALRQKFNLLQKTLMPIPSASSKIIFSTFKFFWACSIFFEHSQIFWSWSKARFYLISLHIWAWSKIFEHIQKILKTVKNIWTWSKNIWTSRWIRHITLYFLKWCSIFDDSLLNSK